MMGVEAMKRQQILVVATAVLALSACDSGKGVSAKNESAEAVQEKVADAVASGQFMKPGNWAGTVKIVDMAMPGMEKMPPEMQEKMKASLAKGHSFENCLTEEDVRDPKEKMAENQGGKCTYDHFTMAKGVIDAKMTCSGGAGPQVMTMKGSYTGDSYDMQMETAGSGEGPAGMSMKMSMSAKRTGACKPGAA